MLTNLITNIHSVTDDTRKFITKRKESSKKQFRTKNNIINFLDNKNIFKYHEQAKI